MRKFFLLLAAPVLISTARQSSGSVGQWKNFTDMKSAAAVDGGSDLVWAATTGGAFVFSLSTSGFQKFTNSEGLSSNELTAVRIDATGRVWLGAKDGSISMYDGRWTNIRDIALSNRIQKSIRRFVQQGDSMFVVSDFGISVYTISRKEFADTYANFGFSTQPLVSSFALHQNRLWVATNQGLATAMLGSIGLTSPTSWTTYTTAQGLPSNATTSVGIFSDTLVAGTVSGSAFFSGGTFQAMAATAGESTVDFDERSGQLFVLSNGSGSYLVKSLTHLNGPSQVAASNSGVSATDVFLPSGSSDIWVATSTRGLARWTGSAWSYVIPNGPQSNQFVSVCVDGDGVLWAASGINSAGKGFYRYDPSKPEDVQWKNFTNTQNPVMQFDDYYKISSGVGNSVWVSSWGRGALEVVADTIRRRIDANSVPSLAGAEPVDPNFVVVGGVGFDATGFPWLVNRTATTGNFLARLVNDTTFEYHRNLFNLSEGFFTNILIDNEGTKWLANSEASVKNPRGLYYYNENRIVSGTESTGGWGFMSTAEGLPNATVMSLAVDHSGDVWVGTDLGVLIVTDPRFPRTRRTSSFPLREQSIQAIAVDGVNNKWVGTREGIFVVNADGTQLIEQYTTLSTGGQLVSNDVRSIAIDPKRGIVYCGTENGLSSLQIAAVQPNQAYSSLEVGPNPFVIPGSGELMIRNLVSNSTIKILNVNGTLVTQFKAQGGGRAFWDGRDSRGKLVSSGVYLVAAFVENGNQIVTGKVAVVRR